MRRHDTTLVVGGTGKTGRRVVERLQLLGLPYRVGARSAQPRFDWEDSKTWLPALEGVGQAYVTYYPDLCLPGALDRVDHFSTLRGRPVSRNWFSYLDAAKRKPNRRSRH
jgi:hypothetical protein